jgi:large subunit ribosomal protein L10
MSYYVKGLVQKEYEKRFAGVDSFMVMKTSGIDGVVNNVIRGALKSKGIRMMVVKNSLMRKAFESLGHPSAGQLFEAGPCTVVFGGDSIVDVAKEIEVWMQKQKKKPIMAIRGAYVEGVILDAAAAAGLNKMPSRAELHGRIAGIAIAPGASIAGALLAPSRAVAGCIKSLIEKKEKETVAA